MKSGTGKKLMIECTQECREKRLETLWVIKGARGGENRPGGKIVIDYPYNLEKVPRGILAVPAACCLLPLAMELHADIRLPACDRGFFETLPLLRDALWDTSGDPGAKSRLRTGGVESCSLDFDEKTESAMAFGASREDYYTLISHAAGRPDLVQIVDQGRIKTDKEGTDRLASLARENADRFGTACYRIRYSGMPEKLTPFLFEAGILAPLAWIRRKRRIYIPASEGIQAQALLKIGGMQVIPDGADVPAAEKQAVIDAFCRRTEICLQPENGNPQKTETLLRTENPQEPRRCFLLGVPEHANLGDHQIIESMIRFLLDIRPDLQIREIPVSEYFGKKEALLSEISPGDPLIFPGGGFFGNLWPKGDMLRRDAFLTWPDHPKIVFPQSVCYTADEEGRKALREAKEVYRGGNSLLSFRDRVSFDQAGEYFGGRIVLAPDIVLYSDKSALYRTRRSGALLLLRDDQEKKLTREEEEGIREKLQERGFSVCSSDMRLPQAVKPPMRRVQLDLKLQQIAGSRIVVTDRLHGLIFCAVTETPCVAFGNSYHKISAAMEWLSDVPYIRMARSLEDFDESVEAVLAVKEPHYPAEEMKGYFHEWRNAVMEVLR